MTANGYCERICVKISGQSQCGELTSWFDSKKQIWDCGEHAGPKKDLERTVDKDPTIGMNRAERRLYKRKGIVAE